MNTIQLEDIPADLATYLDITEASAQVLLSIVVLLAVLLPVMLLSKGNKIALYLIFAFLTECLLVGIGWLDFWVLIGTVAIMAIAIALFGSDVVTGTGSD